jgi:hypothetical protein
MTTNPQVDAFVESRMLGNGHVRSEGGGEQTTAPKRGTGVSPPTLYIPFGTTGCRDPFRDARADRRTRTPAAGARR